MKSRRMTRATSSGCKQTCCRHLAAEGSPPNAKSESIAGDDRIERKKSSTGGIGTLMTKRNQAQLLELQTTLLRAQFAIVASLSNDYISNRRLVRDLRGVLQSIEKLIEAGIIHQSDL